jgi:hypothetical protein
MASGAPGVVSSSFGRVAIFCFFREIQYIYVDTHIYMITHPYKYIYIYTNFMSTSENISRLDLEIHKVGKNDGEIQNNIAQITRAYARPSACERLIIG